MEQLLFKALIYLGSQSGNENIYNISLRIKVIPPDFLHYKGFGKDPSFIP